MAGLLCSAVANGIAYAASAQKTALQLTAPANQRLVVVGLAVGLSGGNSMSGAVRIRVLRQTTAGTGGAAVTPTKNGAGAEVPQSTALKDTAGAEPTAGDVLYETSLHPSSTLDIPFVPGVNAFEVPGGTRLGVELLNPAGNPAVSAEVTLRYHE